MKYIIPGYVEIERNGERTLVTSNLLKNKIKLTDFSIRQEFDDIVKAGGRDEKAAGDDGALQERRRQSDGRVPPVGDPVPDR